MNAIKLAIRFHELYEKYAPEYGYDTKEESRTFDASSPNGKLMIRICREIQKDYTVTRKEEAIWTEVANAISKWKEE
jgi:hypothetical protein